MVRAVFTEKHSLGFSQKYNDLPSPSHEWQLFRQLSDRLSRLGTPPLFDSLFAAK
ncbi:hypothetical protein CLOSTMETH_01573 [[Clostridium] methylpentosum DSM 5476]|uniref:Uncharacterized protein n=1 Tax=[Clostridium] methylpentosum DSM 5476 TaxID=537013 RepID=C0ECK2_9FIRM|nr:hypothetical protein CLOSTMETH_01573 [[Clostridium] methylpentosum DSM 5476]